MREAELFIKIIPKGKQLPFRFRGITIKDTNTRKYELNVKNLMREQFKEEPFDSPISVRIIFGIPRPKSVPVKKRAWPSVKPDLDNLVKSIDSGTGVLWKDDALICRLNCEKRYVEEGYIQMFIKEISE